MKDSKHVEERHVKDNRAQSNACWRCGGLGHFPKDCITTLPSQDGNKRDQPLSDNIPMICHKNHTITASMPMTDFTCMAILEELVSLAITNRKAI